jgi:hypothetical protein
VIERLGLRDLRGWFVLALLSATTTVTAAQEHQHGPPAQDDAQHVGHAMAGGLFAGRDSSGTAWVPDTTPMFGVHRQIGAWTAMVHGNAFAYYFAEGGEEHRRSQQGGSINWIMGMARRPVGSARVGVRAMFSAEPWTVPGCGYPDLLATGETCDGETIHDRQHPHDLFMELAAEYSRPLRGALRWELYGGVAGEPALGPAGFPHRLSAMPNPIAPIGHHWLDATHITFGVVTTGIASQRWKAEGSAFNGREPDEVRHDLDLDRLDSFSGRFSVMPRPWVVVQVSAGRLNDAERRENGSLVDVTRVTASLSAQRALGGGLLATTTGWGMNGERTQGPRGTAQDATTHLVFAESSWSFRQTHTFFGRLEVVGKPAHDLHVEEFPGVFTVGKLQLGYTRYLVARRGLQAGVGGSFSASAVPGVLAPRYGGRVAPGAGVFLTLRPAAY